MVKGFDLSTYIVRNKIVTKKANSSPGTLQPGSSWQENITVTIQQQPHSFSNQVDMCALNNILQSFPTASATTPCAWHGRRAGRRGWSCRRWRRRWRWRWRPGTRDRVECHPQHQPWAQSGCVGLREVSETSNYNLISGIECEMHLCSTFFRYIPFLLIILVKSVFEHGKGEFFCVQFPIPLQLLFGILMISSIVSLRMLL